MAVIDNNMLVKYARLLVHYCLELKSKERLYISTSTLAEPLVACIYEEAYRSGAIVEVDFSFRGQQSIYYKHAEDHQLQYIPTLQKEALHNFDAYLAIRAPFDRHAGKGIDMEKKKIRSLAFSPLNTVYFDRTADRSAVGALKRSLCQYPTEAAAEAADMSLEEYSKFVFNACHLYSENPEAEWLKVRAKQQHIKEYMDKVDKVTYKADHTDISFSVKDRIWMNSDGQTNMPSGEVYSAPIEDSVNGKVHFTFPSIYMGKDVKGITLWVENGEVVKWEAEEGKDLLDAIFDIPGARRFGEVAIGTNYQIQRTTRNILFDEKIGGTIHMAVGQAYKQNKGKNKSAIHWDMITDMSKTGEIWADGVLIYEKGKFLI